MATFNKFQSFVEHLAEGVHNFTSDATCTPTIALCAAANAPVNTNTVLANLTQATYTNLSTRVMTVSSSAQSGGTYKLVLNDLVLTSTGGSTGPFRYVVLYNDDPTSPADPLVGWWYYGSDVTLADGETFTVNADGTNGIFQLV
jgi:hypothetical protein